MKKFKIPQERTDELFSILKKRFGKKYAPPQWDKMG